MKTQKVTGWPHERHTVRDACKRVIYRGNKVHKTYPLEDGTPGALRSDKARCEHFAEGCWTAFTRLLREAVASECVGGGFRGIYPARAWAFVNGELHEARLTNQGNGEYHAFPVTYEENRPEDPEDHLAKAPRAQIPVY